MSVSSNNRMLKLPSRNQRGIILLLMMFAILLVGISIFMRVLSNNEVFLQQQRNTTDDLSGIKESLISYSVLYADYYGVASAGPGHLMCPDTDGDGVEDAPCAINSLGRLPTSMTLPSGDIVPLSSFGGGADQQVWYALSDDFRRSPVAPLNTATAGNLTLDGLGGIAAVLIAPEEAIAAQARDSNSSADYLEAANMAAPDFLSFNQLDPTNFNDRILPIRLTEIFSPVTARVAEVIRIQLDDYHAISGVYPANQNDFEDVLNGIVPAAAGGGGGGKGGGGKGGGGKGGGGKGGGGKAGGGKAGGGKAGGGKGGGGALNPMPAWFVSNDWFSVSNYTQITNDSGSVDFTACNITYTLNFGVTSLGKAGSSC